MESYDITSRKTLQEEESLFSFTLRTKKRGVVVLNRDVKNHNKFLMRSQLLVTKSTCIWTFRVTMKLWFDCNIWLSLDDIFFLEFTYNMFCNLFYPLSEGYMVLSLLKEEGHLLLNCVKWTTYGSTFYDIRFMSVQKLFFSFLLLF